MPRPTPVPARVRRLSAGVLASALLIPLTATAPAQAVTSTVEQSQTVTTSNADIEAPTLSSITLTSPDVIEAGNSVQLDWTSDDTDISYAYVEFVNETGQRIYGYANPDNDFVIKLYPAKTTNGIYRLSRMHVEDTTGNRTSYYSDGKARVSANGTTLASTHDIDFDALKFTVQGGYADALAPTLASVTRITPDVVEPGESIRLQWTSDDTDTHYVDAYFINEKGQTVRALGFGGQDLTTDFEPQTIAEGTYRLDYISIHDHTSTNTYYYSDGRVRTYPSSATPPAAVDLNFDALTFTVQVASPKIAPAAVVFTDEDGTTADTYTVPATEGVDYLLNGEVVPAGTYPGTGTVEITARAQTGFVLADGVTTSWTSTFKATPLPVTPAAVTFADEDGTAADTYTIPVTEGVDYLVNGTATAPGTYPATGTVTVTARAKTDYVLADGADTSWSNTFAATTTVTPAAPMFTDKPSTYTIPATTGVQYYVNGAVTAPGTYKAKGTGTVEITARAQDGYVLTEDATTSWKQAFKKSPTHVTPGTVIFTDETGTAADTYTIPDTEGVDYLVNGTFTAPGTYPGAGTVKIKTKAQSGYVVNGPGTWKTTFKR